MKCTFKVFKGHVSILQVLVVAAMLTVLVMVPALALALAKVLVPMMLVVVVMVLRKRPAGSRQIRVGSFRVKVPRLSAIRPVWPTTIFVAMLWPLAPLVLGAFATNLDALKTPRKAIAAALPGGVLAWKEQNTTVKACSEG